MSQFINLEHPAEHPGLVRVERAATVVAAIFRSFDSSRGVATLLEEAVSDVNRDAGDAGRPSSTGVPR